MSKILKSILLGLGLLLLVTSAKAQMSVPEGFYMGIQFGESRSDIGRKEITELFGAPDQAVFDNIQSYLKKPDQGGLAGRIFAGLGFWDNFAVEFGFTKLGGTDAHNIRLLAEQIANDTTLTTALISKAQVRANINFLSADLMGKAGIQIGKIYAYVKAGIAYVNMKVKTDAELRSTAVLLPGDFVFGNILMDPMASVLQRSQRTHEFEPAFSVGLNFAVTDNLLIGGGIHEIEMKLKDLADGTTNRKSRNTKLRFIYIEMTYYFNETRECGEFLC